MIPLQEKVQNDNKFSDFAAVAGIEVKKYVRS